MPNDFWIWKQELDETNKEVILEEGGEIVVLKYYQYTGYTEFFHKFILPNTNMSHATIPGILKALPIWFREYVAYYWGLNNNEAFRTLDALKEREYWHMKFENHVGQILNHYSKVPESRERTIAVLHDVVRRGIIEYLTSFCFIATLLPTAFNFQPEELHKILVHEFVQPVTMFGIYNVLHKELGEIFTLIYKQD